MPLSAGMLLFLLYANEWLSAFTWAVLGITAWVNYKTEKKLQEYNDE